MNASWNGDMSEHGHLATFDVEGYAIVPKLMSDADCDALIALIEEGHSHGRPGSRGWLRKPAIAQVAERVRCHPAIHPLLAPDARAVQCSLFTKDPDANWSVTPHQDLSVPVRDRIDAPGWSGWCVKENVIYAQPPRDVMEQLVAVRLQLDADGESTGPLEVVPRSHAEGRLSSEEILELAARHRVRCPVPRGGALIMRPLLIHASGKMLGVGRRRVLHFLFAPTLEHGMAWADAV